ncbi:unnamed protein product [Zymoseptoria tritici ST99CH_1A5]|uniref:Uncharacterized protein n=1 Tax=Zymoseptoria tritici ST99CH_1A5 TaxID=1276529 RepID=A0A1Y6M1U5_ZYMTR|nr:unnamed protein product [Zymoseptoria tritici ST99CH_1A5]
MDFDEDSNSKRPSFKEEEHTLLVARMVQSIEASKQPSRADAFVEFFDTLSLDTTPRPERKSASESERQHRPVEVKMPVVVASQMENFSSKPREKRKSDEEMAEKKKLNEIPRVGEKRKPDQKMAEKRKPDEIPRAELVAAQKKQNQQIVPSSVSQRGYDSRTLGAQHNESKPEAKAQQRDTVSDPATTAVASQSTDMALQQPQRTLPQRSATFQRKDPQTTSHHSSGSPRLHHLRGPLGPPYAPVNYRSFSLPNHASHVIVSPTNLRSYDKNNGTVPSVVSGTLAPSPEAPVDPSRTNVANEIQDIPRTLSYYSQAPVDPSHTNIVSSDQHTPRSLSPSLQAPSNPPLANAAGHDQHIPHTLTPSPQVPCDLFLAYSSLPTPSPQKPSLSNTTSNDQQSPRALSSQWQFRPNISIGFENPFAKQQQQQQQQQQAALDLTRIHQKRKDEMDEDSIPHHPSEEEAGKSSPQKSGAVITALTVQQEELVAEQKEEMDALHPESSLQHPLKEEEEEEEEEEEADKSSPSRKAGAITGVLGKGVSYITRAAVTVAAKSNEIAYRGDEPDGVDRGPRGGVEP